MEKTKDHFTLHFNGYSMYPFLKPGDRLVAQRVSPNILRIGDIIIVPGTRGRFTAHRIVKIRSYGQMIVKGDSMLTPDPDPIEPSTILGRVNVIIREDRLIPISTGLKSWLRPFYAWSSFRCLTIGALKLRAKTLLQKYVPITKSKNIRKEMQFMISAIAGLPWDRDSNIDWAMLYDAAVLEGLAGMLYHQINKDDFPQTFIDSLKTSYHRIAALNLLRIQALEQIEDALYDMKMEVMVLKGASLLDTFYPGVGMRPMDDIDLMVRSEDLERIDNTLSSLGYQKNPILSHIFSKEGVTIDIHTHALNIDRIASRAALFPRGMDPIWKNAVPWRPGFHHLKRPDDMDNVILLSQHLLKHSFSKLIWLVDILQILKNHDKIFWTRLYERVDYYEQRKPFWFILYILEVFFHFEPPKGIGLEPQITSFSKFEYGLVKNKMTGQPLARMGPFVLLFYIPGLKGQLTYLWETIFPREEILEQEFITSHSGKKRFFYPKRVFHIMLLLFRHLSFLSMALIRSR